jgi:hypothetical protein
MQSAVVNDRISVLQAQVREDGLSWQFSNVNAGTHNSSCLLGIIYVHNMMFDIGDRVRVLLGF